MSQLPAPILFDQSRRDQLIAQICQIHRDCVLTDNQLLTFLPGPDGDLPTHRLRPYWEAKIDRIEPGKTEVILQMAGDDADRIAGVVVVEMSSAETGPFRTSVRELMVSLDYRRQGVARRLLNELERIALENDSGLLMLDTAVGTPAEQGRFYEKMGYVEVGIVRKFGISPRDGTLVDEKFFYKDLRNHHDG